MPKAETASLLTAGAAATAIGGAYKLSEFLYKAKRVRDVGPANAVYVRLINRVRADLEEVQRLLTVPEVKEALEANKPKAKWVYGAMRDVRGALENITPHTERVAGDIEDGRRVGFRHRLRWLLSEKEKLENREKEVNVAHGSLMEVIGFLTALEPTDETDKGHVRHSHNTHGKHELHDSHGKHDSHNTKVDIDIRRDGPERFERDLHVRAERHDAGPTRIEERDIYIQRERGPRRVVEERETWVEHDRRPQQFEERETWVERRDGQHEERYYQDRHYAPQPARVEERHLHIQRDPRDAQHVEAQYYEQGPNYYDERRYEERRIDPGLPRRAETYEDRVPDRQTFMESDIRQSGYGRPPYGEYAEYGAPQPSGAAEYRRRFLGDPGFGDEIVLNPQPVPPMNYDREVSSLPNYRGDPRR
jgi:hypothetical protein